MGAEPLLDIETGRKLLLNVTDLLEKSGIPYHLEGGTLLGLVRDGDLLPWDHDLDISIPAEHIARFDVLKRIALRLQLWRVSQRYFSADSDNQGWKAGDLRIFKICKRKNIFSKGWPSLDIFVKYRHDGKVWWAAKGRIMGVDARHYDGHETIEYMGRQLKAPVDYRGYLTAKYGDWSTPVKEWNCGTDEGTIVGDLKT